MFVDWRLLWDTRMDAHGLLPVTKHFFGRFSDDNGFELLQLSLEEKGTRGKHYIHCHPIIHQTHVTPEDFMRSFLVEYVPQYHHQPVLWAIGETAPDFASQLKEVLLRPEHIELITTHGDWPDLEGFEYEESICGDYTK